MLSNTGKAQDAFCGKLRKAQRLQQLALHLRAAVGRSLTLPAPPFSAPPTATSDFGNPDENLVIKMFLFASAGHWISWREATQRAAAVQYNQLSQTYPSVQEGHKPGGPSGLLCISRCVVTFSACIGLS